MRITEVTPKRRDGTKVLCNGCGKWTQADDAIVDLDGPPYLYYCELACFRRAAKLEVTP